MPPCFKNALKTLKKDIHKVIHRLWSKVGVEAYKIPISADSLWRSRKVELFWEKRK